MKAINISSGNINYLFSLLIRSAIFFENNYVHLNGIDNFRNKNGTSQSPQLTVM